MKALIIQYIDGQLMKTTHESALDAAFEYAGREMVEAWEDENGQPEAESIAIEYLIELARQGEILSVCFTFNSDTLAQQDGDFTITITN